MVELNTPRYFDPRFFQFGITALILKFIVYYIQSQLNPNMSLSPIPDTVVIRKGNSSATIHLFGATLTSWIVDDQEVLFVSQNAKFDGTKAIRGGVPVVFPHFGPWKDKPQHGFARITTWTVKEDFNIGSDSVTLVLEDSESTRILWDHKFRFEYTVTLLNDHQMKMNAVIENPGEDSFPFTFLWHTYFSVPDNSRCLIKGLQDCKYTDRERPDVYVTEGRESVSFDNYIDRIYVDTPNMHQVVNISGSRTATIQKINLPDTVVWNPGETNAREMSDFGDDEWKNMICVEAGAVDKPVVLDPKQSFAAAHILSISPVKP